MPPKALQRLQDDSAYSKRAMEVLDWTYYDTFKLLSTTLTHRLFTVPLGQAGKTLADTNLPNASQLPQGQNLKVHALKLFYMATAERDEDTLQNIYDVLRNTTFRFLVPGKDTLGTWPLAEVMGTPFLVKMLPSVAGDNVPMISPSFKGVYPLNFPLKIGAVQTFEVEIQHHVAPAAALNDDEIRVGLNGRLRRMS